jgi:hypothetical protein
MFWPVFPKMRPFLIPPGMAGASVNASPTTMAAFPDVLTVNSIVD